jgi:hypothetical protein
LTSGAVTAAPGTTLDVIRGLVRAYATSPDVRSVAVVANAPMEPSPERAAAIDACDLVVRCNSFVLDGPDDPPTVGRTVHVVVFNRALRAAPRVFDSYRERLYLMVEPGRLHREPDFLPAWWPPDLGQIPVPNREVTLPLSQELGLDSRRRPEWATTGLMSVWMARHLFPEAELLLSGFSMITDRQQTSWTHQWGDSCAVGREHHIDTEGALLQSWIDAGKARWLP